MIFDFDGTLVQSNRIKRDAFFTVAREYDLPAGPLQDLLAAHPTADRHELFRRLLGRLDRPAERLDDLVAAYGRETVRAIARAPEVPGADAFLHAHSARQALYVVSATPEEALRLTIEKRGWAPLFRGVYGRPAAKDDLFKCILADTGFAPRTVLAIGDSPADLAAARRAGCPFLGVRADPGQTGSLPPGIPLIERYDRIDPLLEELATRPEVPCV